MQGVANFERYLGLAIGVIIIAILGPVFGYQITMLFIAVAGSSQALVALKFKELNEMKLNPNEMIPIKKVLSTTFKK